MRGCIIFRSVARQKPRPRRGRGCIGGGWACLSTKLASHAVLMTSTQRGSAEFTSCRSTGARRSSEEQRLSPAVPDAAGLARPVRSGPSWHGSRHVMRHRLAFRRSLEETAAFRVSVFAEESSSLMTRAMLPTLIRSEPRAGGQQAGSLDGRRSRKGNDRTHQSRRFRRPFAVGVRRLPTGVLSLHSCADQTAWSNVLCRAAKPPRSISSAANLSTRICRSSTRPLPKLPTSDSAPCTTTPTQTGVKIGPLDHLTNLAAAAVTT